MNHKPLPSNPSSGKDSKLVSRLKGKSGGWSVEQKEAIRETIKQEFLDDLFAGVDEGKPKYDEKRLDELLTTLEAITKGEQ